MRSVKDTFVVIQNEQDIDVIIRKEMNVWVYEESKNNIVSKFRKSVYEAWQQTAIVSDNTNISYRELNILTDSMAHMMLNHGVKKGDHIAIIGDRSIESVIGMISILKNGAVYIPIDSKCPINRINFILNDCKPQYILNLTNIDIKGNFKEINIKDIYQYSPQHLYTYIDAEDIAYIMYTSGTTGIPKGTLIKHNSVTNLSDWFNKEYDIIKNKNVLHMTNISFDVSVEEIFATLLNMGTLFIIPEKGKMTPKTFWNYLSNHKINIAQFVPVTLNFLLGDQPRLSELRVIICGGEKLDYNTKNKIIDKGYNLFNHYGPTETTVDAIVCKASKNKDIIGKPISNTTAYIINNSNELVGMDEIGELYISGVGVAKGYLNNEELTKKKFVKNPFLQDEIMYKTGDRAKYNEDHEIIFCGRFDEQIKINGMRIEIEDIEANISKYKEIKRCSVVVKEYHDHKFLCAYFIADAEIDVSDLKRFCKKNMPLNMIPHYFIKIDHMPLNANEKIDKKKLALLPLKFQEEVLNIDDEMFLKVLKVWEEVLGIKNIGINTAFTEVGGDSMGAAWLCSEIEEKFSVLIPLNLVLRDNFCITDCYRIISNKQQAVKKHGNIVLLSRDENANKNLFFVHGGNGEPGAFSAMSSLIKGYNCWGFRASVLDGLAPTNIKIEEIAKNYITQLKEIQPEGPYNLIGWCIGGSIVYEMGLQLEQQGNELSFLSLVNTFAPNRKFWGTVDKFNLHTELVEIQKFVSSPNTDILNQKTTVEMWHKAIEQIKTEFTQLAEFKKIVYDDMDRSIPNFQNDNITEYDILYYINVMRTFDNARALYSPKNIIKAQCHFFKATLEMAANTDSWQNFFKKPIKFIDIRGNNFDIWKEDNVDYFSIELQKALGE